MEFHEFLSCLNELQRCNLRASISDVSFRTIGNDPGKMFCNFAGTKRGRPRRGICNCEIRQ